MSEQDIKDDFENGDGKKPGESSPGAESAASKRRLRRMIYGLLSIPPCIAILIGLALSYHIYASNRIMDDRSLFPLIASPHPPQSLLIFAPHCDDEVLGAGGLMYQAVHNGCPVHVVVITNGDGFRIGVLRDFHKVTAVGSDFVNYGYMRQNETRTALGVLGLKPDHIAFLGYPDRGLLPMWTTNWTPDDPFRSHYTEQTVSPYADSPTPHATYCGEQVLSDIERQMEKVQPTDIYVTHPSDDHPDHAAASVFVRTALDRLRVKGEPWALKAHLHYYLVHRGDWPVPQGLNEGFPLPPPAQMVAGETSWQSLPLTRYQVMRKYAAIKRYKSQTEVTGRFLYSFARKNELFGTVDSGLERPLPIVADGAMKLDAGQNQWRGIEPVAIDPAADSVGRMFQGSGDIVRIFLARDSHNLYARVDTRTDISPDVSYGLSLRPLDSAPAPPPYLRYVVKPGHANVVQYASKAGGVEYIWRGRTLEYRIPLSQLPLPSNDPNATIDVAADSMFADLTVDRTGFHGVAFNSGLPDKTAVATPR